MSDKTTIALFNYGGGMRGLIPAHLMSWMEERTGLRMAEMVDIFAGPSTGAILNGALTLRHPDDPQRPKYRARHLVKFYEREGINIFPQDSFRAFRGIVHDFNNRTLKLSQLNSLFRHGHYDPQYLGKALRALYGRARLSDSLRSLIIPTYNIDGGQIQPLREPGDTGDSPAHTKNNVTDRGGHAVWLKHIMTGHPDDAAMKTPDVQLYDAVMSSCAAPSYFPCHHMNVTWPGDARATEVSAIDGVIFDNPAISYMGAIRRHVPPDEKLVMIILGTGYTNKSVKKEDWNRYGALGIVDPVNDLPLINIFFHASESALMECFAEDMGDNLYVFNKSMVHGRGPGAPSTQIDDASPDNIRALERFSHEVLEDNRDRFDEICHILVNSRDRRTEETRQQEKEGRLKYYMSLFGSILKHPRE